MAGRGRGSRSTRFGALLVGAYLEGELRFLGAVGHRFHPEGARGPCWPKLRALETSESPFVEDPTGTRRIPSARCSATRTGSSPSSSPRSEFRELTSVGRLRAPSFKGLRDDKAPEECLYEDLSGSHTAPHEQRRPRAAGHREHLLAGRERPATNRSSSTERSGCSGATSMRKCTLSDGRRRGRRQRADPRSPVGTAYFTLD